MKLIELEAESMGASAKSARQKLSTTVAPKTLNYLETLIKERQAHTLAEAVDLLVERLRAQENRERLERATAAYFDQMLPEQEEEESSLAAALAKTASGIDFDREP